MNPVERLLEETERAAGAPEGATEEQLVRLLELREEALAHLREMWEELPAEERERFRRLLKRIGSHDAAILDRMRALREEASRELTRIRQIRAQQEAYQRRGYKNSLFFDEYK